MTQPPDNYRYVDETVMSNFDHSINRGRAKRLKKEKILMKYTGHNFFGEVWWQDESFHCSVWKNGKQREVISSRTIDEMMELVSDKYGQE